MTEEIPAVMGRFHQGLHCLWRKTKTGKPARSLLEVVVFLLPVFENRVVNPGELHAPVSTIKPDDDEFFI